MKEEKEWTEFEKRMVAIIKQEEEGVRSIWAQDLFQDMKDYFSTAEKRGFEIGINQHIFAREHKEMLNEIIEGKVKQALLRIDCENCNDVKENHLDCCRLEKCPKHLAG
jgi:hypothetical protein